MHPCREDAKLNERTGLNCPLSRARSYKRTRKMPKRRQPGIQRNRNLHLAYVDRGEKGPRLVSPCDQMSCVTLPTSKVRYLDFWVVMDDYRVRAASVVSIWRCGCCSSSPLFECCRCAVETDMSMLLVLGLWHW